MRIGTTLAATLVCTGVLLGTANAAEVGIAAPAASPDNLALHLVNIQVDALAGIPDGDASITIRVGDDDKTQAIATGDGTYFAPVTGDKLTMDIDHPEYGTWQLEVVLPEDLNVRMSITMERSGPVVSYLPPLSASTPGGRDDCTNCDINDLDEGEGCLLDVNGGCNSPVPIFSEALCGDWWCGTAYGSASGTRDTDWYRVVVTQPSVLSGTLISEFSGVVYIVDGIDACAPVLIGTYTGSNDCSTGFASAVVNPGNYVVFVATADFYTPECDTNDNDYRLHIECTPISDEGACCFSDGTCADLSDSDCQFQNGTWNGLGTFCATTYCPVVPTNDACADAIEVAVPSTTMGNTIGATIDSEFPTCGTSITSPGVWYYVYGTGNTMTATTCSDVYDYDTKISVYCVSCDEPTCVDGNDDSCSGGASGLLSTVEWCSQNGALYLVLVHGFGGQSGIFQLDVFDDGAVCGDAVLCLPEGACCLPDGSCAVMVETACYDAGGGYQGDDTDCSGLPAYDGLVTIEILTDNYGSETSWELFDDGGAVVAAGGGLSSGTFYSWNIPVLTCGCYTWTIYDSFGDGICCGYGEGYYNVYFDGSLVATGGEFGSDESVGPLGDCTGCGVDMGACCLPDGSCLITTGTCCAYAGGIYVGAGTDCGTGLFPVLAEDFNSGMPADWTVTDDDGSGLVWMLNTDWGDGNYTGGTGDCADASSDEFGSASYDTSLITPMIDLSGAVGAQLDCLVNFQNFAGYDYFYIDVSYDGGGAWNNLLTWNEDHGTFHGAPGEAVSLPLAGGSAMTMLRFRYYDPVSHWNWEVQVDDVVVSAELVGLSPCQNMDIKPGSCPNAYQPKAQGKLPVSLVGTDAFDVSTVDPASLMLGRVDGVGGLVAPMDWFRFGDTSTPFYGDACDCHEYEGDGITDLKMRFERVEVTDVLMLDEAGPGECVPLALYGMTYDGVMFIAVDNVTIVPIGGGGDGEFGGIIDGNSPPTGGGEALELPSWR